MRAHIQICVFLQLVGVLYSASIPHPLRGPPNPKPAEDSSGPPNPKPTEDSSGPPNDGRDQSSLLYKLLRGRSTQAPSVPTTTTEENNEEKSLQNHHDAKFIHSAKKSEATFLDVRSSKYPAESHLAASCLFCIFEGLPTARSIK